jgi:hypothetical protein
MLQNSHAPSVKGIFAPCPAQDRRTTFGWTEDDATDVDLEDYH